MPNTVSIEITVDTPSGGKATGELSVDLSETPHTGTFTPSDGNQTNVTPVTWNSIPNGNVGFNFQVSGSPNGDFPAGANNSQYTYRFTGNMNADGDNPQGKVNWPSASLGGDPEQTWQSGGTAEEPFAAGKGAS